MAGVPDVTLELSEAHTGAARDLFVVAGPPGTGKTRVLEAIIAAKEAISPYGMFASFDGWIADGADDAAIELDLGLDAEEQSFAQTDRATATVKVVFDRAEGCRRDVDAGVAELLGRYEHDPKAGKIEYLPANRRLSPPGPAHGLSVSEQRFLRLGRDADKYSFVPRFLVQALAMGASKADDDNPRARFEAALSALCPDLRLVDHCFPPTSGGNSADPLRCFSFRGGPSVRPSELGTTASHAVLVAATAALVRYDRSIVLLDRPESSVDERTIGAFIRALRGLGADLQLIVATSSPSLKSGVEGRAICTLGTAA